MAEWWRSIEVVRLIIRDNHWPQSTSFFYLTADRGQETISFLNMADEVYLFDSGQIQWRVQWLGEHADGSRGGKCLLWSTFNKVLTVRAEAGSLGVYHDSWPVPVCASAQWNFSLVDCFSMSSQIANLTIDHENHTYVFAADLFKSRKTIASASPKLVLDSKIVRRHVLWEVMIVKRASQTEDFKDITNLEVSGEKIPVNFDRKVINSVTRKKGKKKHKDDPKYSTVTVVEGMQVSSDRIDQMISSFTREKSKEIDDDSTHYNVIQVSDESSVSCSGQVNELNILQIAHLVINQNSPEVGGGFSQVNSGHNVNGSGTQTIGGNNIHTEVGKQENVIVCLNIDQLNVGGKARRLSYGSTSNTSK